MAVRAEEQALYNQYSVYISNMSDGTMVLLCSAFAYQRFNGFNDPSWCVVHIMHQINFQCALFPWMFVRNINFDLQRDMVPSHDP